MIKKLKILSFYLVSALFVLAPNYSLASTRAIQIELLLSGITNPTTGERVAAGTAYFYDAGTTDAANVWTEKEKTNPYSSYTLDSIGAAQLYGEGNYKIVIKDSDGATVDTFDNIRLEFPYYGIRTVTYGTVTMLSEDDYILCNTTGGDVTINFIAAADRSKPLKVQRISGTNDIIIDPSGSETIDSAATLTISTDAIVEIVSDGSNLRTAGYRSGQSDADGDTQLVFDRSLDDDVIRFDIAGVQNIVTIDADGLTADEVDTPILKLSGTQITANANDLNIIDGLADSGSLTAADLLQLDGVTVGGNSSGDILTTDGSQTLSGKNFSQNGAITITDTRSGYVTPLSIKNPNAGIAGGNNILVGVAESQYNTSVLRFYYAGDGSQYNYGGLSLYGVSDILLWSGFGTVSIGTGAISTGAMLQVGGEVEATSLDINGVGDISDTLTLSKGSGNGLVVTSNVDFNGNEDLAGTLDIGSGTTRRVAPAGTFVNNATGDPNISNTQVDITTVVTVSTWESIGPTGSGADNIWTALDSVPTDADWIELKIETLVSSISDTANSNRSCICYMRKNGSSAGTSYTLISKAYMTTNSSGNGYSANVTQHKIPVSSVIFDSYWTGNGNSSNLVRLSLTGWGFNP